MSSHISESPSRLIRMVSTDLKQTIPFDPRFPNQNQTRNCWQNYVDFHRCQKIKVRIVWLKT